MWLAILFAIIVSVMIGLLEILLSPITVNSREFSTVNITIEVLRAALSFGVLGVTWYTREFGMSRRSLVIAMTFLAAGVFTILRLLTFPEMPSMAGPAENMNHSIYFSIFLRWTIGGILLATVFVKMDALASKRETGFALGVTCTYIAFVTYIVLVPAKLLPDLQANGPGLNSWYLALEYGAMILSFLAAIGYARLAASARESRYALVTFGLILFAQAGFTFTVSPGSDDLVFLIGRSTALVGFFLIFYAVTKDSLVYPYIKLDKATRDFRAAKLEVEKSTADLRALAQDLTERRLVEAALRKSEKNYRDLVDTASDGIWKTDVDDRTIFVNPQMAEMLGYTVEEMAGKSTFDVIDPGAIGVLKEKLEERKKGVKGRYDLALLKKNGERIDVLVSATPTIDELGEYVGAVASVTDITERKRAEDVVQQLNKSLAEQTGYLADMNKELEAFCYSVSHDLRAPLRSIDGFSNILVEDYAKTLDDKGKDYLRRVRSNCQRMGELIDDLLDLSRVTRDEMKWERVNLSRIAKDTLDELRKLNPERKIEITIEGDAVIHGDARLYQILLSNLLDNAWKFTEKQPNPKIEFGVTAISGEEVYFVRDNGAGFDMKYASKLFTPFQRLHSSDEFAGTGIGLATAQRIVHRHGGRIWAESAPDKGATFYFTEGRRRPSTIRS